MNKAKLMLILAILLAFAAGGAAGTLANRVAVPPPEPQRKSFDRELNLSDEQHQQMREIWREAGDQMRTLFGDQRGELRKRRDQAVRDLFNQEQLPRYQKIMDDYAAAVAEMDAQRQQIIQTARDATAKLLTEEQRAKFDEMMRRRRDSHHGDRSGNADKGLDH